MRLVILGAAAGGGLPQWNCGCRNCADARAGRIAPMTQSSVAVSYDGSRWVILNASPDIRTQIASTNQLHPTELRGSPIEAVILTNGDIDHVAGLLSLREQTAFDIYATQDIRNTLRLNPMMDALNSQLVIWHDLGLGDEVSVAELSIEVIAVPGKVPLYMEGDSVVTDAIGETTIGLIVSDDTSRLAYVPGCAALTDDLVTRLGRADLILFDGTVWDNSEMKRVGVGGKTGQRMGHIPISGPDGSLSRLSKTRGRKAYIHLNNTNPVLQPDSSERRTVRDAGWEICADGMELNL